MTFPSNPNEDDLHEAFGRKLRYRSGKWQVVSSPSVATVTEEAPKTEAVAQAVDLPMTGNEIGAMAYVQESNRLYVWNGSGWFEVALVNTNPTITAGGSASYILANDGTPTVITLTANDPEGIPITWSYTVTSGSLGGTTVTNVDNVFTITPSTNSVDAGTFQLTFTASDGVNVDTSASSFSLSFLPNWALTSQQQKILATDIEAGDTFGNSVAISGDTIVVGAINEDAGGSNAGAAYVFTKSGSTWTQQAKLLPSDPQSSDNFGKSVAISGDTIVVGTPNKSNSLSYGGAIYIFTRSGTTWTQQAKLQSSDLQAYDNFGYAVAIDGDTVVTGAIAKDTAGSDAGAAYVFTRSGTSWTQQAKLLASDAPNTANAYDYLGISVAIDGDTVVAGAYGADARGAAYVYTRSGTIWTEQAKLVSSDIANSDNFGISVGVSGNTAIVGAWWEDGGGAGATAGSAYIFTRSGTTWAQQAKLIASDAQASDRFGGAVAIDGDIVIIGADYEDTGGSNAGSAYIFSRDGTTWTEEKKIQASDAEAGDSFGRSVAIDTYTLTVVVGAGYEDTGGSDAGAAYIFQAG